MYNVADIRALLSEKYQNEDFVIDKSGVKTVELIGASFIADEELVFGSVDKGYVLKELDWYLSKSLNVYDISEPVPEIWKKVSTPEGLINSNYGYLALSEENGSQFDNCVKHILENPDTRRASMIYTRPTMHSDYNKGGMSDFCCTNAINYYVRNGLIHANVQMRSNDGVFGFKNDLAWQQYVLNLLSQSTNYKPGNIIWNSGSFHIYERHFFMIDHWIKTGQTHITKLDYDKLYS